MGMDVSAIREGDFVTLRARVVRAPEPAMPGRPASLRAQIGEARLIVEAEDIAGHEPSLRVGDRVAADGAPGVVRMVIDEWAVVKLDGRAKPVVKWAAALHRETLAYPEHRAKEAVAYGDLPPVVSPIEVGDLVEVDRGKHVAPLRGRVVGSAGFSRVIDFGDRAETRAEALTRIAMRNAAGWLNADVRLDLGEDCVVSGFVFDVCPRAAGNPHTLHVATPQGVKIVAAREVRRAKALTLSRTGEAAQSGAEAPCDV